MLIWLALCAAAYAQISDDEDLLKRRQRTEDQIEGSAVDYMGDYTEEYNDYDPLPSEGSADSSDEFDEVDNVLSQPVIELISQLEYKGVTAVETGKMVQKAHCWKNAYRG